jgi:hypothetical protein
MDMVETLMDHLIDFEQRISINPEEYELLSRQYIQTRLDVE